MRALPQQYCPDQADHPAHGNPGDIIVGNILRSVIVSRCPGRYTPSAHRAPDPSPAQPADPFAGIPGAYED